MSCDWVLVVEYKYANFKFIIRLCYKLCEGKDDDTVFMNLLEEGIKKVIKNQLKLILYVISFKKLFHLY